MDDWVPQRLDLVIQFLQCDELLGQNERLGVALYFYLIGHYVVVLRPEFLAYVPYFSILKDIDSEIAADGLDGFLGIVDMSLHVFGDLVNGLIQQAGEERQRLQ